MSDNPITKDLNNTEYTTINNSLKSDKSIKKDSEITINQDNAYEYEDFEFEENSNIIIDGEVNDLILVIKNQNITVTGVNNALLRNSYIEVIEDGTVYMSDIKFEEDDNFFSTQTIVLETENNIFENLEFHINRQQIQDEYFRVFDIYSNNNTVRDCYFDVIYPAMCSNWITYGAETRANIICMHGDSNNIYENILIFNEAEEVQYPFGTLDAIAVFGNDNLVDKNDIYVKGTLYMYAINVFYHNNIITNNNIVVEAIRYAAGISLNGESSNNILRNNTIKLTTQPESIDICGYVDAAYAIVITENSYYGGPYRIINSKMDGNLIDSNTITGSSSHMYAIEQFGGRNTVISNNNIDIEGKNPMAVALIGAYSTIINNNISVKGQTNQTDGSLDYLKPQTTGIYLYQGSGSVVSGNNITTVNGPTIKTELEGNTIITENILTSEDNDVVINVQNPKGFTYVEDNQITDIDNRQINGNLIIDNNNYEPIKNPINNTQDDNQVDDTNNTENTNQTDYQNNTNTTIEDTNTTNINSTDINDNINSTNTTDTNNTEIPDTNNTEIPDTNNTEIPDTNNTDIPDTNITEIPDTNITDIPDTNSTEIEDPIQNNTNTTITPETNTTDIEDINNTEKPENNTTNITETNTTDIEDTNTTEIPDTNNTEIPDTNDTEIEDPVENNTNTTILPDNTNTQINQTLLEDNTNITPEYNQTDIEDIQNDTIEEPLTNQTEEITQPVIENQTVDNTTDENINQTIDEPIEQLPINTTDEYNKTIEPPEELNTTLPVNPEEYNQTVNITDEYDNKTIEIPDELDNTETTVPENHNQTVNITEEYINKTEEILPDTNDTQTIKTPDDANNTVTTPEELNKTDDNNISDDNKNQTVITQDENNNNTVINNQEEDNNTSDKNIQDIPDENIIPQTNNTEKDNTYIQTDENIPADIIVDDFNKQIENSTQQLDNRTITNTTATVMPVTNNTTSQVSKINTTDNRNNQTISAGDEEDNSKDTSNDNSYASVEPTIDVTIPTVQDDVKEDSQTDNKDDQIDEDTLDSPSSNDISQENIIYEISQMQDNAVDEFKQNSNPSHIAVTKALESSDMKVYELNQKDIGEKVFDNILYAGILFVIILFAAFIYGFVSKYNA